MSVNECKAKKKEETDSRGTNGGLAEGIGALELRRMLVLTKRPTLRFPCELELRFRSSKTYPRLLLKLLRFLRKVRSVARARSIPHPRSPDKNRALHTPLSRANARHLRLTARQARIEDKSRKVERMYRDNSSGNRDRISGLQC
jgi:hypothetical protein